MSVDLLLDVGGTGIKGAACPRGGPPGPLREFPAHANADRAALLRHFSDILRALAGDAPLGRVAMAFPGPFDYEKGIPLMRGLAKYEALHGVCLPEALEEIDICPEKWYFINDVSAYALGAAQCLPARHRALTVCLGTGAGSAFLVDGRLCTDAGEGVPENGWIYPLPYGTSIVDDYLSDRGLRRLSRRLLGEGRSPRELNADEPAFEPVWRAFGEDVAKALTPVLTAFRPTDLVLGGKISLAWPRFGTALTQVCEKARVRLRVAPDTSAHVVNGLLRWIQR